MDLFCLFRSKGSYMHSTAWRNIYAMESSTIFPWIWECLHHVDDHAFGFICLVEAVKVDHTEEQRTQKKHAVNILAELKRSMLIMLVIIPESMYTCFSVQHQTAFLFAATLLFRNNEASEARDATSHLNIAAQTAEQILPCGVCLHWERQAADQELRGARGCWRRAPMRSLYVSFEDLLPRVWCGKGPKA